MSFPLRLTIGLFMPLALVLAAILLVPTSAGALLGVSIRSWCLFACAPATSLLLACCLRSAGDADEEGDRGRGQRR